MIMENRIRVSKDNGDRYYLDHFLGGVWQGQPFAELNDPVIAVKNAIDFARRRNLVCNISNKVIEKLPKPYKESIGIT